MEKDEYLKHLVKGYIPENAELLVMDHPYSHTMVGAGSIDEGDVQEVVAAYQLDNNCYLIMLKYNDMVWEIIETIDMGTYEVTYLKVAPVISKMKSSIIIGLKMDDGCSKLQILDYTKDKSFTLLIEQELLYDDIDVYDMEGETTEDGKVELALWIKDQKKAYDVKIYRWSKDKLTYAIDVYKSYYKKVIRYYKDLVNKEPEESMYWFYLAMSQMKVDHKDAALKSIEQALTLENPYPSKAYLNTLKKMVTQRGLTKALNLYPASKRTTSGIKWGYINQDGKFIIKPIYKKARAFDQHTELAVVKEGDYLGLIDRFGNYVIKPKFLEINGFSEGLAIVVDEEGFKVTDESGTIITKKAYDFIGNYNNNRAVFRVDNEDDSLYGYLDEQGDEVIKATYLDAFDFYNKRAIVKLADKRFGLIGLENKILNEYEVTDVGPYVSENLLSFKKIKPKKCGYINISGDVVLPATYSHCNPFYNERAIVDISSKKNKYGLINTRGEFLIKPVYSDLKNLLEDRYAVGEAIEPSKPYRGVRYGIVNRDGTVLSGINYYNVTPYKDWIASAYDQKNTFFINMSGGIMNALPIVEGSGTLDYVNNVIKADVDYRTSYLTPANKLIYEQNKQVPLSKRKTFVIEEKYRPNIDYLVYYPQLKGLPNILSEQIVNEMLLEKSSADVEVLSDERLDYMLYGDFDIIFNEKQVVTIKMETYKFEYGSAHGMTDIIYAHIDLKSGQCYRLNDLFIKNSQYEQVLETKIKEQVKQHGDYDYVFEDADFTISNDQLFTVSEDTVTIYYKPYQIAPYVAGFPSFTIPFGELEGILNKNGKFYQAFN